ncbi:MAG: hypothetical protein MJZ75_06155 [Paludibacteraceae bacterium]|nr:hypothetical protein [Paludibacteraceae bacterium]
MTYIEQYINTINKAELRNSIIFNSQQIVDNIKCHFVFSQQLNGLLLGDVQSGKTAQMLGAISRMADQGYRLFVLLTTDNVDLQRQTFNRVKQSLVGFNVLSEQDEAIFNPTNLSKPHVIVLKKNIRVLNKWKNIFVATNACKGLILAIFDDEADATSLNTKVNKDGVSPINKALAAIKATAIATIYEEVTATPQAVLLQSEKSGWHPSFVNYFKPGKEYLGGNFFYSSPKSFCIRYTNEYELTDVIGDDDIPCPEGLRLSLRSFLIVCAYKKLLGDENCNFLIHPSARIYIHNKFVKRIQEELNLLTQSYLDPGFDESFYAMWEDLQMTKPDLPAYEDIRDAIITILDDMEIRVIPLNSKSFVCRDSEDPDALDLEKGFNIIVGGNTLGRGITFPHLQTVYYCRTAKIPQADTFWQHSRIFGYDRDASLVRIFIPQTLYSLFTELNKANEVIKRQIEVSQESIELIYPKGIKPTRPNVVNETLLHLINGNVNYFQKQPLPINVHKIDNLISCYGDKESINVDETLIISLLELTDNQQPNDFDSAKFIRCIQALALKRPSIKFRLIVRLERDIAKGTGTLLSENDRKLGDSYPNEVVLTMYRLIGNVNKGWDGHPLWVANIKLPANSCFYNVEN